MRETLRWLLPSRLPADRFYKFFALDSCTDPVAHWNHFAIGSAASLAKLLFACLPCSGMQFFLTPLISTSI